MPDTIAGQLVVGFNPTVLRGNDGRSITSTTVDNNGHLILTFSDNSSVDVGLVTNGVTTVDGQSGNVSLTGSYLKLAAGATDVLGVPNFKGAIRSDDGTGAALIITDAMQGTRAAMISWATQVSASNQFLIHLTTASGFGGTGIIGLAPDGGGNAIFVDNKGTANNTSCIKVVNENTNTVSAAYGIWGQQAASTSPLVFLETSLGGTVAPVLRLKGTNWGAGQVLADHMLSDGSTITWRVFAQDGKQEHLAVARFSDYALQAGANSPNAGLVVQTNRSANANTELRFYRWTGGANQYYPFRITAGGGAGNELTIQSGAAASTVDGTETLANPFLRVGTGNANCSGAFFNAAPITQPNTTGTTTGFTAGTGTTVVSGSTFTGNTGATAYTIGDVVNALKRLGLIAA